MSLFKGRHRGFSPVRPPTTTHPPTHTHTLSLKDSISRLNELFKTEGLFPDPWLCKSHCCQPIKQVRGPHSRGEQTTEIEQIERRENFLVPFRVYILKEINTTTTKQSSFFDNDADVQCRSSSFHFIENSKAADRTTIHIKWRSGLVCRTHVRAIACFVWQNLSEMFGLSAERMLSEAAHLPHEQVL